jgi:hypothetical protein
MTDNLLVFTSFYIGDVPGSLEKALGNSSQQ